MNLAPGVYYQEIHQPEPPKDLRTGVPGFIGFADQSHTAIERCGIARMFSNWSEFVQFANEVWDSPNKRYLYHAIKGYFENLGDLCWVVVMAISSQTEMMTELARGLNLLDTTDSADLVCAPGIMQSVPDNQAVSEDDVLNMQSMILEHCAKQGDQFAILDALPGSDLSEVLEQRSRLSGANGALYYPWISTLEAESESFLPPCGHIAGIYARSDRQAGVQKAPANEILEGVYNLEVNVNDSQQGRLNPVGINCIRSFPGRGIRIWGARTLSSDSNWSYVNVRRLFITIGRWISRNLTDKTFEPNNPQLWTAIERDLNAYFSELHQTGAFQGETPEQSFYVKCDEETNPPESRDLGRVVTEIGLSPSVPNEFIIVRIIHSAEGITTELQQ